MAAFEKELSSVQETLQILGKMVDPVPLLQDDLGHLFGQIATMDAKLGAIYETMRRIEDLLSKQGSSSKLGFRHLQKGREWPNFFFGPNQGHFDHRRKLELPLFEGDNPHG